MATCPAGHQSRSTDYCDTCGAPIAASGATATPTSPAAAPGGKPCPHCAATNPPDALFCESCGYDFTTGAAPRPNPLDLDTPVDATPEQPQIMLPESPAPEPVAPAPAIQVEHSAAESGARDSGSDDAVTPSSSERTPPSSESLMAPAPAPAGAQPTTADASEGIEAQASQPGEPPVDAATPTGDFSYVAELWVDPDWYKVQEPEEAMPSPGLPEVVPLRGSHILIGRTSRSKNIVPDIDCGLDAGCSRRQAQLTSDGGRWFVEDLGSSNGTFVGNSGVLPTEPIKPGKRELKEDDRIYVGAWTRIVVRKATPDEKAAHAG